MDFTNFLAGLLILLAGRKLFWLFVGIMGFLVGMHFGFEFFAGLNGLAVLLFSFCIGILGALLALVFQQLAIILAGFLGGGYLLINIFGFRGIEMESTLFIFLIGGLCGALAVALIFNWALIVLSSFVGAMLITQSFTLNEPAKTALFIICAAIGVVTQRYFFAGNWDKKAAHDDN